jgi:hypothetical protein
MQDLAIGSLHRNHRRSGVNCTLGCPAGSGTLSGPDDGLVRLDSG